MEGLILDAKPVINPAVVTREDPDGGMILVNCDTGAALALNASGKIVWNLINGRRTPEALIAGVRREFPDAPDSVTVVVRPRPGIYGLDIASTVIPRAGATIRFKYPVHFSPPVEALRRYGSASRYEHAMAIAVLTDGANYALLPSRRPALDNLESALPGPGTYLAAAPR